MKKSFEYDLTKFSPDAPTRTEEFITADGVKTLTTDANDGAVLIQDSVDEDSLNPVTASAVAAAIEAGGGGSSYSAGDGISIAEDTISAKVDGTTIGVNASGELEALGGGGTTYDAGTGIDIDEYNNISVKLDGNTIGVNGQGELEVLGGGGGASYSAGAGISIDSNNAINADVDNKTVSADRLSEVSSSYTQYSSTQYLTLNLASNLPTLDASTSITQFQLRRTADSGSYGFSYDTDTQSGLYVRVQIGNTSAFDDAVVTSTRNLMTSGGMMSTNIMLDGSTYTDALDLFKASWGQQNISVGNLFDFSGYTFDQVFDVTGECYIRFVAWDTTSQQVVGDPLTLTTSGGYPNVRFFISSSANPTKLAVKYNTGTLALTNESNGLLTVKNPLPDSSLASQGDVLKIGTNGPEWGSAGGGGGGAGAYVVDFTEFSNWTTSDKATYSAAIASAAAAGQVVIGKVSPVNSSSLSTTNSYVYLQEFRYTDSSSYLFTFTASYWKLDPSTSPYDFWGIRKITWEATQGMDEVLMNVASGQPSP